jgi:hypothetical protein
MKSKIMTGMLAMMICVAGLYATTYDQSSGPAPSANSKTWMTYTMTADFTKNPGTAGDVYKLAKIPSNSLVSVAAYTVIQTNAVACTFNIGDSSTTNRFVGSAGGNAATLSTWLTCSPSTNLLYTADDYVTLQVATGTSTNGKVKIKILVYPIQDRQDN